MKRQKRQLSQASVALSALVALILFPALGSSAHAWDKDGLPKKNDKSRYSAIISKNPFGPLYVEEVRTDDGPKFDVFKDVSLAGVTTQGDKMTVKLFDFKKGKSYEHAIGVKNAETGITIVSVLKNDVWTRTEVKASDGRVTEDLGYKDEFLKRRKPAGLAKKTAVKGKGVTGATSGRSSTSRYDPRTRSTSSSPRATSSGYNRTSSSSRPRVMLPSRSRTSTSGAGSQGTNSNVRVDPNVQDLIDQTKKK